MTPDCSELCRRIAAHAGVVAAFEDDLREHVAGCAVCAATVRRVGREVELLRSLERRAVPPELDGRVVAACQAGHREQRVADALRRLSRSSVPRELDRKVLDPAAGDFPAPSSITPQVLERLITEDLRDPSKVVARRIASRLRRLQAPDELFARVDGALRAGDVRPAPVRRAAWRAVAGGLLCASVAGFFLWRERDLVVRPAPPTYRFQVEYASSLAELDPVARGLLASVSGGLTALPGIESEHPLDDSARREGVPR